MNYSKIFKERRLELEEAIREVEHKLSSMPEGTLVCYKHKIGNKKYSQFYKLLQTNGKPRREYLSHKNNAETRLLARKKLLTRQLADMKNELKCVNYYIINRVSEDPLDLLSIDSPYRKLLLNNDSFSADWEYLPYNKSTDHPEHLTNPAPKNELVRSKSEATIAYILYSHGIPYRYEEIHDIYGYPIATDFTIMHPKTGQIILWEHFGRCDDPNYQSTIDFKMYRYIRDGYLPGVNFITTYEDSKHPLDPILVEEIVKKFFL